MRCMGASLNGQLEGRVLNVLTTAQIKIVFLLHSVLKGIQEWIALICSIRPRSLFLKTRSASGPQADMTRSNRDVCFHSESAADSGGTNPPSKGLKGGLNEQPGNVRFGL